MEHVDAVHCVDGQLTVSAVVVVEQPADILAHTVVEGEWGSVATRVAAVGVVAGDGGGVGGDCGGGVCGSGKIEADIGESSLG